jgi:16S rRNA (guanine527-N7)-methyltransferase
VELPDPLIKELADYYGLIEEQNPLLHLVGPCAPEEFAIRHILESLTLLKHLPQNASFADVGTGAGLPSIPCLIVRQDLRAVLIESKEKKASFLNVAVETLDLKTRTTVENKQYSEVDPGECQFVTCRALDKFTERLPHLLRWSGKRELLLFGGPRLGKELQDRRVRFAAELMPMSTQRFLYVLGRS